MVGLFIEKEKYGIILDELYGKLIDYCLRNTSSFMLVYAKYQMKPYSSEMEEIRRELTKFEIKRRINPSWPGTPATYSSNTEYQIVFYACEQEARNSLLKTNSLFSWTRPEMPQDLAFFRGNKCWLYTVAHEGFFCVIDPTQADVEFLKSVGLYDISAIGSYLPEDEWQFFEDLGDTRQGTVLREPY